MPRRMTREEMIIELDKLGLSAQRSGSFLFLSNRSPSKGAIEKLRSMGWEFTQRSDGDWSGAYQMAVDDELSSEEKDKRMFGAGSEEIERTIPRNFREAWVTRPSNSKAPDEKGLPFHPPPKEGKKINRKIVQFEKEGHYYVSFPYDRSLVFDIKKIRGATWQPSAKHWMIPKEQKESLQAFAEKHGFSGLGAGKEA